MTPKYEIILCIQILVIMGKMSKEEYLVMIGLLHLFYPQGYSESPVLSTLVWLVESKGRM